MDESYKWISIRVSPVGIKSLQANSLNNRSSKLNLMENMQISAKDADCSSAQKAKKKGRDLAECMELDLYASTYLRTPAPGVLKHHRTTCVVRWCLQCLALNFLILFLQRYPTPTNPFTAQNFSIATSYLILWLTARHKTISTRQKNKNKFGNDAVELKPHFLCKYKSSLNQFFCMNLWGIQQLWHIKPEREREENSSDE